MAEQIAAQALATPIRKCLVTGARLPAFFHVKFLPVIHPTTGALWFEPEEHAPSQGKPEIVTARTEEEDSHIEDTATAQETLKVMKAEKSSSLRSARAQGGGYMLASRSLLQVVSQASRRQGAIRKFVPYRWKTSGDIFIWREDMEEYVLGIIRRTLVGKLKYLQHRHSGYISTVVEGVDGIQKCKDLGCVLWLGAIKSGASYSNTNLKPPSPFPPEGPSPYLMVNYQGHHVPVYNLRAMLGVDCLQALRDSSEIFTGESVMLKAKAITVKTQMLLWRLQIYVTHARAATEEHGQVEAKDTTNDITGSHERVAR